MATPKSPSPFVPSTALEKAIHAGDFDRTVAHCAALTPQQRKGERSAILALKKMMDEARWATKASGFGRWGGQTTSDQTRALGAALLLCGTAKDVSTAWLADDDLIALGERFHPAALEGLADALLELSPNRIGTVQSLIAAGLVSRPESDDYVLGLMALPRTYRMAGGLTEQIAADEALQKALLRMFEVEGTAEFSLASVEKYTLNPALSWTNVFLALSAQGVFTRAQLLEKTLDTLERDWPQHRSGWFSRFHEALAPNVEEMRGHAQRYLGLCQSRIPPTVTLALASLATLDHAGAVSAEALMEALPPVLSSPVKGHIEDALRMLDRIVSRETHLARSAATIAVPALAHSAADLQKKVLARLASWDVSAVDVTALHPYEPGIAATNRAAFEKLVAAATGAPTGASPEQAARTSRPPTTAPQAHQGLVDPLDDHRCLQPLEDPRDVVERIAFIFENDTEIDELERVIEALVRRAPIPADERKLFAPVEKRAVKVRKPVARALARLVAFVVSGERTPQDGALDPHARDSVRGALERRIDDLMAIAAQGKGVAPLSVATHRRGFIDPARFIERARVLVERAVEVPLGDQVLGLLRLAAGVATADLRARARSLPDSAFTRALRYALGDDVVPGRERALFVAAARIRHCDADDERLLEAYGDLGPDGPRAARFTWSLNTRQSDSGGYTFHDLHVKAASVPARTDPALITIARHAMAQHPNAMWYSFAGRDEALVRYSATLLPSSLEAFFAEGARALGNNLDWWEAQWHNRAYLEVLLDPTVPLRGTANLTLALALGGKEPGQTAVAVDAFVAGHVSGRLDVTAFGHALRHVLAMSSVKAPRYKKSFESALRMDDRTGAAVFGLLCLALESKAVLERNDVAALLELLLELAVAQERGLPPGTRAAIERCTLSGRGKSLRGQLLSRPAP